MRSDSDESVFRAQERLFRASDSSGGREYSGTSFLADDGLSDLVLCPSLSQNFPC